MNFEDLKLTKHRHGTDDGIYITLDYLGQSVLLSQNMPVTGAPLSKKHAYQIAAQHLETLALLCRQQEKYAREEEKEKEEK